ncbi:hypothetical protein M408DRAFT_159114 [Serendipita vermifera MAFF 305830]|uniref:Uncharacterized protein n=1 Tax=Serendipita vermifera MAFF 305830 TaxID=933852 RepID=A0A0C3AT83_SERVB|nr:hypothetical protein M408DRAFT_159114 [Serendipita vermifera MAFF 305830]
MARVGFYIYDVGTCLPHRAHLSNQVRPAGLHLRRIFSAISPQSKLFGMTRNWLWSRLSGCRDKRRQTE